MFHGIKLPLSQTSACLPHGDLFTVCLTHLPITEGLNFIRSVIFFMYIDALTWDGTALSQLLREAPANSVLI